MRFVIAGAGGHARSVIEALRASGHEPVALTDPTATGAVDGVPIAGTDDELERLRGETDAAAIGLGGVGSNEPRANVFKRLDELGYELPPVIHPAAVVASGAAIGRASVVLAAAVVGAGAQVGSNVIVNTGALVEHDVVVGDHAHIATGAALGGGVTVRDGAHVGLGASVLQKITIGAAAVVGAGAVVIADVPDGVTVAGVPAVPK